MVKSTPHQRRSMRDSWGRWYLPLREHRILH